MVAGRKKRTSGALVDYAWPFGLKIVSSALLPERRETGIANAVVLQRKYYDYITQGPSILVGPLAAKDALVLGDRLLCHGVPIDA
jgi:hypothetical protein